MATKTISVDLEAYQRLRRAKSSPRESFSQVIKRAIWQPKQGTAGQLLESIRAAGTAVGPAEETLDQLDRLQESDAPTPDRWADAKKT